LDSVVPDVPWGAAFDFGKGVDALSGSLKPSAIAPGTKPVEQKTMSSHQGLALVQQQSDLDQLIKVSVAGKYNIEGVDVSGSAQYVGSLKVSELAISLVLLYQSTYVGLDELENPKLTAEAAAFDPARFRDQYGDYFISGGQRGSGFVAVYRCTATKIRDMTSFKAAINAEEEPDVFSADGAANFKRTLQQNNIDISVDVFMDGYEKTDDVPSAPWTPDKVVDALAWFKKHEVGIYRRAELMHYSALNSKIPRTVAAAPDVFAALQNLFGTVWDITALYNACPRTQQPKFQDDYNSLMSGLSAQKGSLASSANLCVEFQNKADALQLLLRRVVDRIAFYSVVIGAVTSEPGKNQEIDADGRQAYLYGCKGYVGITGPLEVKVDSQSFYRVYEGPGNWDNTFHWQETNRIIVGWEVVSNWADSYNGWWCKRSDQILLNDNADVYVKSLYDRGTNWTLNIYSVAADEYRFA
jgi:hypothetical protein